jgi:hypothetical protein
MWKRIETDLTFSQYHAFYNPISVGVLAIMLSENDDVYSIKLERKVLQSLISTRRIKISQMCCISKENTHEKTCGVYRTTISSHIAL